MKVGEKITESSRVEMAAGAESKYKKIIIIRIIIIYCWKNKLRKIKSFVGLLNYYSLVNNRF